jgi:RecA/RadA recombinase
MAQSRALASLERLTTGSSALDAILGGGIPKYSVNVIGGDERVSFAGRT